MLTEDFYNVSNQPPRGFGIIIVNGFLGRGHLERIGIDQEEKNLKALFTKMGLGIHFFQHQTKKETIDTLKQFSARPELERHSMIAISISSHGSEHGIYGNDYLPSKDVESQKEYIITVDEIKRIFNSVKCKSLAGKPKLFVINGCRGTCSEEIIQLDITTPFFSVSGRNKATTNSDFLILYSSVEGYYSYRSPSLGSLFISSLLSVYLEYGNLYHFQSILPKVNRHLIEKASQSDHPNTNEALAVSAQWESTCTRLLFLSHVDPQAPLTGLLNPISKDINDHPFPEDANLFTTLVPQDVSIFPQQHKNPSIKTSVRKPHLECVWSECRKQPKGNTYFAPYQVQCITGITFDKQDETLYLLDSVAGRIWLFTPDGDHIERTYHGISHPLCIQHELLVSSWGIAVYNNILVVSSNNTLASFEKSTFSLIKSNTLCNSSQLSGLDISKDGKIFVCQRKSEQIRDRNLITIVQIDSLTEIDKLRLNINPETHEKTKILDIKCRSYIYVLFIGQHYNLQLFNYNGEHYKNVILAQDLKCSGYLAINETLEIIAAGDLVTAQLRVFDYEGSIICSLGSKGNNMGCFNYPTGITFDDANRIIIACSVKEKNIIQCFNLNNYER